MKTVYIKWSAIHNQDEDEPYIKSIDTVPDPKYKLCATKSPDLLCQTSVFQTDYKKTKLTQFVCGQKTNTLYFLVCSNDSQGNYKNSTEIFCFEDKKQLFKKVNTFRKTEYTTCCIICNAEHDYKAKHKQCWTAMMQMLKQDHDLTFNCDETNIKWFKMCIPND